MFVETVPATFTQHGDSVPASFTQYDLSNFYFGQGDHIADLPDAFAGWWRDALPGGYHLYREPLQSAPDREVLVRSNRDGRVRRLINFSSYNCLGMATAEVVKRAAVAAIERYGLGASGVPILSGMFEVHRELEAELAAFRRCSPPPEPLQGEAAVTHMRFRRFSPGLRTHSGHAQISHQARAA
jgi:hypothetical protein